MELSVSLELGDFGRTDSTDGSATGLYVGGGDGGVTVETVFECRVV